jgi:hypothetical protein
LKPGRDGFLAAEEVRPGGAKNSIADDMRVG